MSNDDISDFLEAYALATTSETNEEEAQAVTLVGPPDPRLLAQLARNLKESNRHGDN